MAYPTIWAEGTIASGWTGHAFYVNLLAALTVRAATVTITNEDHDVTGLGAAVISRIPGLRSATATLQAFAATPYIGNFMNVAYSAGGYAINPTSFEINISTPTVHDITSRTIPAGAPLWRYFRPDVFQASARYTAMADSATALVVPSVSAAALPTVTMTYGSGATLAGSGIIQQLGASITKGNKNLANYVVDWSGAVTAAGGIFGSYVFGSQVDPMWNGANTGTLIPLVVTLASGRTITFADSFWTSIRISGSVGAPVMVDIGVRASGVVTIA